MIGLIKPNLLKEGPRQPLKAAMFFIDLEEASHHAFSLHKEMSSSKTLRELESGSFLR